MRPVTLPFLPGEGLAHELLGALLVTVALALVFALARLLQRRAPSSPELSRKLIHVGSGVVAGFFPWLFAHHWTVLLLGLALVGLLRLARERGMLPELHAVERESKGEFYYPLGVYLLFVLARPQPVFYLIALSALVLSDTAAAVLGQRYGRIVFTDGDQVRSLEGSAAFFLATFLGVHLPLVLLTPLSPAVTVLVAGQLALLVTSFEAISRGGNDNLIVPLATYYLLLKLTHQSVASIAYQLTAQLVILALTLWIARRTRFLTLPGALAVHLVLYAAFSLGNPGWMVAPLFALFTCIALDGWFARASGRPTGGQQVRDVFYVSIVSVVLLFADNSFATLMPVTSGLRHPFFAAFVGALGAQTAIMAFQALSRRAGSTRGRRLGPLAVGAAAGFVLITVPGLWVGAGRKLGADRPEMASILAALALCLIAPPLYLALRRSRPAADPHQDLRRQALAVSIAVALVVPLHLGWIASR